MQLMPNFTKKALCLSLFLLVFPTFASEQEERVGLVLGGGGAKGLAHIGVLLYLEEHRIPVDFVVGTSMGAIAGGLYAQGHSAASLEELVLTVNWQNVFTDQAPRAYRSIRRKEEDRLYPTQALVGFSDGEFKFPSGLIQGQRLMPLLREYSIRGRELTHFDNLPLPFRATAVDIETGELLVIEDGDLALAMRASMAIPGIFSPVHWHNRYLVDGGMVNNLPIDLAQEMNATRIIAVDVGEDFPPFEELQGPLEVMEQAINLMIRNNSQQQVALLNENDVHIVPQLLSLDIGAADFGKAELAIRAGYEAAERASEQLLSLQVSPEQWTNYRRSLSVNAQPLIPRWFRIENSAEVPDQMLWANIATESGRLLDPETLNDDVERIYGLGYFDQVDYQIMWEDDVPGIELRATPRSWGPDYLGFGLTFEENFDRQSNYRAAVSYLKTQVNDYGAELQFDLQIGNEPVIRAQYWQPLRQDASTYTNTRLKLNRERINNTAQGQTRFLTETDRQTLGFDIGTHWRHTADVRLSLDFSTGTYQESFSTVPEQSFQTGSLGIRVNFDSLDSVFLPTQGTLVSLQHQWFHETLGSDENFQQFSIQGLGAATAGNHTLVLGGEFATTLNGEAPIYQRHQLGGFMRLSGYERNALSGQHSVFGQAVYLHRLEGSRQFGTLPVYLGAALEAGNVWQTNEDVKLSDLTYSTSVLGVVTTPVGALYLGLSQNSDSRNSAYLAIGRPF